MSSYDSAMLNWRLLWTAIGAASLLLAMGLSVAAGPVPVPAPSTRPAADFSVMTAPGFYFSDEKDASGRKLSRALAVISFHIQADGKWSNIPPPTAGPAIAPAKPMFRWQAASLLALAANGLLLCWLGRRLRHRYRIREGLCIA